MPATNMNLSDPARFGRYRRRYPVLLSLYACVAAALSVGIAASTAAPSGVSPKLDGDGPAGETQAGRSPGLASNEVRAWAEDTPAKTKGSSAGTERSERASNKKAPAYVLEDAALVARCVSLLRNLYLVPDELEPAGMFAAGVREIAQNSTDALWVEPKETEPAAFVVGRRTLLLEPSSLAELSDLVEAFSNVFSFYLQAREIEKDDIEVEYAALRGMLGELDRPTRLLVNSRLDAFKLRSRGTLSGIGSRIGRRQDEPTIVEVLENSPSSEVGIQEGDKIVRVDGESTVNMVINEVVHRIRGPVGTIVTLDIRRGQDAPLLTFPIKRRKIRIENVEVLMLPDDVGYVRITNFNNETLHNFRDRIDRLQPEGVALRGIVVDLRGNGGGSLKQSAFMANEFIGEGVIVETEGRPGKELRGLVRKIEADAPARFEGIPMAVLVNSRTASGAEILSGALKYMDRAIVLGQRTFGKGSVQKVYSLRPKASLKMTVARYKLSGGHYIQSVGIEPDIELIPLVVEETDARFRYPRHRSRHEDDEEDHNGERGGANNGERGGGGIVDPSRASTAGGEAAPETERPVSSLIYMRRVDRDLGKPEAELRWEDFEIRFAAQLLTEAGAATRSSMLLGLEEAVDAVAAEEDRKIQELLAARGVDWSDEGATPGAQAKVKLTVGNRGTRLQAGDEAELVLRVKNIGEGPFTRLRGVTESADSQFDGLEFLVGRIEPGETRTCQIKRSILAGAPQGLRQLTFHFTAGDGQLVEPFDANLFVVAGESPSLEAEVTYHDKAPEGGAEGGDRAVSPGETIDISVWVRNVGVGESGQLTLSLLNPLRKDIELSTGRAILEPISRGEERAATLSFRARLLEGEEITAPFEPPSITLRIRDRTHRITLERDLEFKEPWSGRIQVRQPRLELSSRVPSKPVSSERFRVTGDASSAQGIQEIAVYRGRNKVHRILPALDAEQAVTSTSFEALVDLVPGSNRITVLCRDESGLTTRRQIWLNRKED